MMLSSHIVAEILGDDYHRFIKQYKVIALRNLKTKNTPWKAFGVRPKPGKLRANN